MINTHVTFTCIIHIHIYFSFYLFLSISCFSRWQHQAFLLKENQICKRHSTIKTHVHISCDFSHHKSMNSSSNKFIAARGSQPHPMYYANEQTLQTLGISTVYPEQTRIAASVFFGKLFTHVQTRNKKRKCICIYRVQKRKKETLNTAGPRAPQQMKHVLTARATVYTQSAPKFSIRASFSVYLLARATMRHTALLSIELRRRKRCYIYRFHARDAFTHVYIVRKMLD